MHISWRSDVDTRDFRFEILLVDIVLWWWSWGQQGVINAHVYIIFLQFGIYFYTCIILLLDRKLLGVASYVWITMNCGSHNDVLHFFTLITQFWIGPLPQSLLIFKFCIPFHLAAYGISSLLRNTTAVWFLKAANIISIPCFWSAISGDI